MHNLISMIFDKTDSTIFNTHRVNVLFRRAQQPNAGQSRPILGSFYITHTQWHITVGRTLLNEGSARPRDLHQATHSIHKRQQFMPLARLEPAFPASERSQALAVDRSVTGIGIGERYLRITESHSIQRGKLRILIFCIREVVLNLGSTDPAGGLCIDFRGP